MKKKYKEGVDFVFEENPELAKIGTEQDYSEYIKTIFPESKVKDIVYHGTYDKFDKPKGKEMYFTKSKEFIKKMLPLYKPNTNNPLVIMPAIINVKNIFDYEDEKEMNKLKDYHKQIYLLVKDKDLKLFGFIPFKKYDNWKLLENIPSFMKDYDSSYIREDKNKNIGVFDSSKVHILGSKEDIEEFKEYVKDKNDKHSLESKIISGLFIFLILFGIILTTFNITGNVVETSGVAHRFIGIILFLLGISGFFVYKKLRS